jgi:hypothetical protein
MNITGKYYIGSPMFLMEQFNRNWKQVHKKKPIPYAIEDWELFQKDGTEIVFLGTTYTSKFKK